MVLTWIINKCRTKFVFKGDDDVLVNPWELEKVLQTFKVDTPAIYGQLMGGEDRNRPIRFESRYQDLTWNKRKIKLQLLMNVRFSYSFKDFPKKYTKNLKF
jgi:hypothetical protein